MILHAHPSIVFTSDTQNYCGMSALDSCSAAVTSVPWDPGRRIVFHAIAAFPAGSSPRLKVLSFGIDYDPTKFVMAARGTCADFEIPGVGWLAPGTGTSQSWTTGTRTALLTEAYWFAGYAYSEQEGEDSTSVALIPHPRQHGVFVDDAFPSEVDTIAGYGRLGFGSLGLLPCAALPTEDGWVGPDGGDDSDGADGGSDGQDDSSGEDESSPPLPPSDGYWPPAVNSARAFIKLNTQSTPDFLDAVRDLRHDYGIRVLVQQSSRYDPGANSVQRDRGELEKGVPL
jgi:hypothetical protein